MSTDRAHDWLPNQSDYQRGVCVRTEKTTRRERGNLANLRVHWPHELKTACPNGHHTLGGALQTTQQEKVRPVFTIASVPFFTNCLRGQNAPGDSGMLTAHLVLWQNHMKDARERFQKSLRWRNTLFHINTVGGYERDFPSDLGPLTSNATKMAILISTNFNWFLDTLVN